MAAFTLSNFTVIPLNQKDENKSPAVSVFLILVFV